MSCASGDRLRALEEDNRRLSDAMGSCLEDLNHLRHAPPRPPTVRLHPIDPCMPAKHDHRLKPKVLFNVLIPSSGLPSSNPLNLRRRPIPMSNHPSPLHSVWSTTFTTTWLVQVLPLLSTSPDPTLQRLSTTIRPQVNRQRTRIPIRCSHQVHLGLSARTVKTT